MLQNSLTDYVRIFCKWSVRFSLFLSKSNFFAKSRQKGRGGVLPLPRFSRRRGLCKIRIRPDPAIFKIPFKSQATEQLAGPMWKKFNPGYLSTLHLGSEREQLKKVGSDSSQILHRPHGYHKYHAVNMHNPVATICTTITATFSPMRHQCMPTTSS